MKIQKKLINPRFYGDKRHTQDIKYIVVQTINNKTASHYHINNSEVIQTIPDDIMSDAVNGGKLNKNAYLHGICTKYNSIVISVPDEMSLDDKQACLNLIMTIKQRYKIDNENIIRQYDVTGEVNPKEWYDVVLWDKDIKKKLIDV